MIDLDLPFDMAERKKLGLESARVTGTWVKELKVETGVI